jgi:NAD(P)-dependent dehydrogenase (short-subunit alcohol dehydrogenase family)
VTFDLGLSGRRALVTAGTKGVGAAVVDVLSENGATIVTTARSIPRDSPASAHYIAADITTPEGCAHVAEGVLDHLGGIDIVVNVLGGSQARPNSITSTSLPLRPSLPCTVTGYGSTPDNG